MVPVLMMVVVLAGAISGVIAILNNEKKKNAKKKGRAAPKVDKAQKYTKIHLFLWDNFLVRGKYRALYERVGELGVYSIAELRVTAVKFFLQTTGIAALVVVVGIFCFQDLIASIILIGFGYLMQNVLVDKQIDKVHFQLVKQLSVALSSVREMYTKYGTIPDAINECKKGKLIQTAFEKIYLILTSNDGAERLDEFYATVPVRLLQTFANVCYILNDSGDQETSDGTSAFKQGVTLLKNEVDLEIRKLNRQKLSFGMLEWMPIVPLFTVGIVQSFFITNIPGTSVMYNGMLGYVARLVLSLLSLVGYYVISIINSPSAIKTNDRMPLIDTLLKIPFFKSFIKDITPKKARYKHKFDKLTKGSLTAKTMEYLYASKVVVSAVTAVLVTLVLTLVMQFAREFVWKNTESLSMVAGSTYTVAQQEIIKKMDYDYMSSEKKPTDEEALELVQERLPDIFEMDKLEQVERLSTKWDTYYGLGWHWWFILIIFASSALMWFTPPLMIMLRKYLVKTEAEEDILQMQTMLSILMYTSLDTLEAIYWLIQTSKIHKDILVFCYHEYPSNPEVAIERMKSKVNIAEFQNICDKLISTINYVSLRDAFGDLVTERAHVMQLREMVQEATIKKKRSIASPLAMAPLFALIIGYILLPVGILGVGEFMDAFSEMGYTETQSQ